MNVKNEPSSLRFWGSNPRPLVHESPPITTMVSLPKLKGGADEQKSKKNRHFFPFHRCSEI